MEVLLETYKLVRENDKRLFLRQRCMVYVIINIALCYNCGRLSHNGKKCYNKQICIKCTGNHETDKCNSNKTECTNCIFSNKTYRTNLYTNHSPSDMTPSDCEILKNKIKKYIDATDYLIKPEVPIWKPVRPTQLNIQQRAAAANQLSRTEVSALKLPRRQRASHQSTGSVFSIGTAQLQHQQHQVQHMAQNHEVLEDIHKQLYQQEIAYNDLNSLNQDRKATDNLILYLEKQQII